MLIAYGYTPMLHSQCVSDENAYVFNFDGKKYEVISELKNWAEAAACAVERGGILAEISSKAEQDTIYSAIVNGAGIPADYTVVTDGGGIAYVWIGATDHHSEGTWIWDGNGDSIGTGFWNGQGAAGAGDGTPVDEMFNNWGGSGTGTPNEPDDYGAGQDGAAIALAKWPAGVAFTLGVASEWNDISSANELYFVIEYDCMDSYTLVDIEAACRFHVTPDGQTWTTSGSYSDTIRNPEGCDSVYVETFNVITIDTTVVQDELTLTAPAEADAFQWLDCGNGHAPIEGATDNTFTPSVSGSYAVELAISECRDTSACHSVTVAGIHPVTGEAEITLYPGPNSDLLYLNLGKSYREIRVTISDIQGRIIRNRVFRDGQLLGLEFREPPGIYFITVDYESNRAILKFGKN
jgi:hypothetical protein